MCIGGIKRNHENDITDGSTCRWKDDSRQTKGEMAKLAKEDAAINQMTTEMTENIGKS